MSRSGILGGNTIDLRTILVDDSGVPVSADALPTVYIYDPSVDAETIDAEIEAGVFTSAIANGTATLLGTGFYEFSYAVPSAAEEGTWVDVWIAELETVELSNIQNFIVTSGATFTVQTLAKNQLIEIFLGKEIADLTGELLLGEDITLTFTTQYSPFYTNVESVRMEGGPLLNYIPDDTIALMIFWASLEADYIKPPVVCDEAKFCFARARYAIYDAALRALMSPGGSFVNGMHSVSGGSKSLGELSIKKGSSGNSGSLSGGLDPDTFKYLKGLKDEWWRVVNSGACIVPGQGFEPTSAIRGYYDPARRPPGRLWEDPVDNYYEQPGINMRSYRTDQRMKRSGFSNYERRSYGV